MFSRKTKLDSPPKPPTKAEILEDLRTFPREHFNNTHRRFGDEGSLGVFSTSDASLNSIDSQKKPKRDGKETESERQLVEWWEKYEKFLADIDDLKDYQRKFETKKIQLAKLDETIGLMGDDIQTRITDSLEKAMAEIPESEQDLK